MGATPKYANEIIERLTRMEVLQESTAEDVKEIHECVFGNSNPESGLIYKVSVNAGFRKAVHKLLWLGIGTLLSGIGAIAYSVLV